MTHIRRIRGFLVGRPQHTSATLDCSTAAPPMRATTASRPTDCSGPPRHLTSAGSPHRAAPSWLGGSGVFVVSWLGGC